MTSPFLSALTNPLAPSPPHRTFTPFCMRKKNMWCVLYKEHAHICSCNKRVAVATREGVNNYTHNYSSLQHFGGTCISLISLLLDCRGKSSPGDTVASTEAGRRAHFRRGTSAAPVGAAGCRSAHTIDHRTAAPRCGSGGRRVRRQKATRCRRESKIEHADGGDERGRESAARALAYTGREHDKYVRERLCGLLRNLLFVLSHEFCHHSVHVSDTRVVAALFLGHLHIQLFRIRFGEDNRVEDFIATFTLHFVLDGVDVHVESFVIRRRR